MDTSQFLAAAKRESAEALPSLDHAPREYYELTNRAYHTWDHVIHVHECAGALLRQSGSLNSLATIEKEALVVAISWHDIFQGSNHELASAAKLYHNRPNDISALAARMIVEGTTHLSTPDLASLSKIMGMPGPVSGNLDTLIATIHDADLMILGEDATRYETYAHGIVVEALAFGLSLADYRDRRAQFLRHVQGVVQNGLLFKTAAAQKLNSAVLENVRRELERLQ